jgi:hypothetical protein
MFGSKIGKRRLNSKASPDKRQKEKSSLFGRLEVLTVKTLTGYKAFLAKQEEIWGQGKTKAEALGKMVEKHPEMFGLAIEEKKRPNPLNSMFFDETNLKPNFDYAYFEKKLLAGLKVPKEMLVMSTPKLYGDPSSATAFGSVVALKFLKGKAIGSFEHLYNFHPLLKKTNMFEQEYQAQWGKNTNKNTNKDAKLFIDTEHSITQDTSS